VSSEAEPIRSSTLELRPNLIRSFLGIWSFARLNRWTVAGFLLLVPLLCLSIDSKSQSGFLYLAIDFYQFFLLPVYCLSVFGPLIRDEVQLDTLGFLITRPLTRSRLLLLKYLALMLKFQVVAVIAGVILLATGFAKGVSIPGAILPFFLSQALGIVAYGALATLFGLLSKKYMVFGLVYGAIVEFGFGRIPTNVQELAISHHMHSILATCPTIKAIFDWEIGSLANASLCTLGAGAFAMTIAMLLFTTREFHHADDMQK
jgi:ABC-type transport system involved in multi-copper enzyme maturation permease subunit